MKTTLTTTGTLLPNEDVDISAEVAGRLSAIRVKDGATVRKDQVLFELESDEWVARRKRLVAQLDLARKLAERAARLAESGAARREDADRAATEVAVLEAQIEEVDVSLERTRVKAPFAGRVGARKVSPGAWVTPGMPLISLADAGTRLKLDFTLPERYAAIVAPGLKVRFRVAGRDQDFTAEVVVIEPRIDAGSRSLLCRAVSANPQGLLVPGAFATVTIPQAENDAAIIVPTSAIVPIVGGHAVYVLRDGKAARVDIRLGARFPSEAQVDEGLRAGDIVLTSNLLRLRPGVPIRMAALIDQATGEATDSTPPAADSTPGGNPR